jgi:hypothetical protein
MAPSLGQHAARRPIVKLMGSSRAARIRSPILALPEALADTDAAVHDPSELFFNITMTYKHSILGLAAGTALLVATGCSKQESPAASAASEKPQPVQAPKAPESQPAASAKLESAVTTSTAATTASAAAMPSPATGSVAVLPQKSTTTQSMVKAAAASGGDTAKTAAAILHSQQTSLAQAGTNQLQALAATATNRVLAALGMTNQVAATTTNQVATLLEQAKNLTSNQKYQEALATLSQLYATKLTPEQKQQADDLKAQVQTAMTQKAASALGNFLGGKK